MAKRDHKRETVSFQIAAQNNAIRTNYVKVKIYNMQKNSKCILYRDKDETINHTISECSKLTQREYKTRYDWLGNNKKDLCKNLNLTILSNGISTNQNLSVRIRLTKFSGILRYKQIPLIPARRPDLAIINKKRKRTHRIVEDELRQSKL